MWNSALFLKGLWPSLLVLAAVLVLEPGAFLWVLVAQWVVFLTFCLFVKKVEYARPAPDEELQTNADQSNGCESGGKPDSKPEFQTLSQHPDPQSEERSPNSEHETSAGRLAPLHRLERLAAVGRLASSISHEVNNPLSFISSNLQDAREDTEALLEFVSAVEKACELLPEDSETYRAIETAWKAQRVSATRKQLLQTLDDSLVGIERISQITKSIKSLTKESKNEKTSVQINEEIERIVRVVQPRLRDQLDLKIELLDPSPRVVCDPCQIGQVILNLILNAVQSLENREGQILLGQCVHAKQTATELEILLKDNGPGMTPEVSAQAFDPFFTTRPNGAGTGVGLSVSRRIVEEHGGRIELETAPEQGCCFRIFLPMNENG